MVVAGASTRERSVQRQRDVVPLQNLTGLEPVPAEVASVRLCKRAARRTSNAGRAFPACHQGTRGRRVTQGAGRVSL